jgi:predicted permease
VRALERLRNLVQDAWQDAALGLRLLRRSPIFAATAILSLAVGIGANTAIFTVADALLFRPPAGITNPSELVLIGSARGDGGLNPLNHATYLELARRATSFGSVFAQEMFPHVMGMIGSGSPVAEPVLGRYVTANFFRALGASPSRGRVFADGDDATAILDFSYWKRRFNGDEAIVGQALRLNGRLVTIVGVAAPEFQGTDVHACEVWLAIGPRDPSSKTVIAGGRLRPGVSFEAAVAELDAVGRIIGRGQGTPADPARPLGALTFSRAGANRNVVGGFAIALMALVSLVLAAACANVAGVMLTRASARERELALRAALGAGRGRLARQLLTETIVLFLFSGFAGIVLARVLLRLARLTLPALPSLAVPLSMDWRVLLFALSLSLGAAVLFGVLPAFKGSRVEAGALKDGARSSAGRSRLRSVFVAGQIACGVLLVMLSASFVRVLRFAGDADPGFDSRGVDVATLDSSVTGDSTSGTASFWATVIDRVRQIPAVERASIARVPPGGLEGIGLGGVVPGDRPWTTEAFSPGWNIIGPGYFATIRIPMIAGRDFAPDDSSAAPRVVIVSELIARRFWPEGSAIGKPIRLDVFNAAHRRVEPLAATVVGVVGDIKSSSLVDGLADPYVYLPFAQSEMVGAGFTAQMSIVTRRRGEASLAGAIATAVQNIDQRLVLTRTESLAESVAFGLTAQRVLATISGATGFVALLLASMGIYGVTAYTVALRRREFAIRLALGAPPARIIHMVFGQSTWLVVIGLGIGLALAIGVGQILSVFFYGLPAAHMPTLAGTVALFLALGAAASIVPAGQAVRSWRRALRED